MSLIADYASLMLEQLMFELMKMDVGSLSEIRMKFGLILKNYEVGPKEQSLVVYTESKNEMFLKKFLLAKAVAGLSKNSLKHYSVEIRKALQTIGKDADTVTSEDIQYHLATIMQRTSKIYADNVRRNLSSFFSFMQREELILKNPMNRVENIKLTKEKKKAFTELEVEQIRDACKTRRETAMIELLLSTGCRVSELISIKIGDIKDGQIDVLGKGEKHRIVHINARAELALKNYLAERKDKNLYVFPRCSVSALHGNDPDTALMRKVRNE